MRSYFDILFETGYILQEELDYFNKQTKIIPTRVLWLKLQRKLSRSKSEQEKASILKQIENLENKLKETL